MTAKTDLANKIIDLTMDIVKRMQYYAPIGIESIKSNFSSCQNIDETISRALWILDHNVKRVIESERDCGFQIKPQIHKKFPNWEDALAAATRELNAYKENAIYIEHIARLEDENKTLRNETYESKGHINVLYNQIESLRKMVDSHQLYIEQEKQSKEPKNTSSSSFFKGLF